MTIPYTYLIGWVSIDRWYYGVRFARNCHPGDLWTKYFTSSKVVNEYRKQYGRPDVVEIRQLFNTPLQAREWEYKVLKRLRVNINERWLNKTIGKSIPPQFGRRMPEEERQLHRKRMLKNNPMKDPEVANRANNHPNRKGRSFTEEHKNNLRGPKKKVLCEYCNRMFAPHILFRFHDKKCKFRTQLSD